HWILVGHVNVREPQVTQYRGTRVRSRIPRRILRQDVGRIYECLLLDNQRNSVVVGSTALIGQYACFDEIVFSRIHQQVSGSLTGIYIKPRGAVSMVVVEHQPAALLGVRPEESSGSGRRRRHIGYVLLARAF